MYLGETQKHLLRALSEHKKWYRGCGWLWDTHSGTKKLLESLVKKDLVTNNDGVYTITSAGKDYLKG